MKPLAVALVLVAVVACSSPPPTDRPPAAPMPPDSTVSPPPTTPRQALEGLPVGAPPRIGYVVATTYTRPDGGGFELPRSRYALGGVDAFDGGLLVDDGLYFEGTTGLSIVTAEDAEELGGCSSSGSADGDAVAWATFACPESGVSAPTVLHLRSAEGELTQWLENPPNQNVLTAVVGLLDGDVLFSRAFGTGGVFRSDLVHDPRRITGLVGVSAVEERGGLLAGHTDPDGYGVVVRDTRAGRTLWRDRRWSASEFSPDGRLLLGWSRPDGWSVRDARTGVVRHVLAVPQVLRIHGWTWEDSRHLLAVSSPRRSGGRQAIVRVGLDGSLERTTAIIRPGRRTGYLLAD